MELPRWKCHKVVRAARILERLFSPDPVLVLETGDKYEPDDKVWSRLIGASGNLVGGYLVFYEDGFVSWSPAQVFEEGYTLLEGNDEGRALTKALINQWGNRLEDGMPLSREELAALLALAYRGADPTIPAPAAINGKLLSAAWSGLSKVSIEVEPGVRQIWVKGATIDG